MSDLISRQAAIDAVFSLCEDCDSGYCGSCRVNYPGEKDVIKVIRNLPSVQPEQRWIPCSERLPEEDADYLVTFENGEMRTASKEGITQNYRYGMKMLAWMPLPEPYTERWEE